MEHRHAETEDIINRGGGELVIELLASTPDGGAVHKPIEVQIDGCRLERRSGRACGAPTGREHLPLSKASITASTRSLAAARCWPVGHRCVRSPSIPKSRLSQTRTGRP